jgi:ABC-type polysaccharide/polyol phosphate transport system ATPase subunit
MSDLQSPAPSPAQSQLRASAPAWRTAPHARTPEVAVSLSDVSVRYQLPTERIASLKECAVRRMRGRKTVFREFLALTDINLTIMRGAAVALVGRNGAGKSTMLKLIARVLRPTTGRVVVTGHVAPLIELGAGMNPELTGRENIFINGAMLGFTEREMRSKIDRIIEFAGLQEFIDAPMRTYSSGMSARLGFAVATEVNPDILIVDEALSVGDEAFQKKCMARMREFRDRGITLFFVTHAVDTIGELCPKAVLLEGGRIVYAGATEEVVALYRSGGELDKFSESQKLQVIRTITGTPLT